jgi:hypothetical protein
MESTKFPAKENQQQQQTMKGTKMNDSDSEFY